MYMHPYFIQYSSTCSSYGVPQRLIVVNNNLVKSKPNCSKDGEKDMKQDNQYLQPRWCASSLSHTQKKETATNAQERVYGTIGKGCTSKVCDHEAVMEAQANCIIVSLKKQQDMADNIYHP